MLGKTHKLYFDVVLNNFLIELDKRAETPELKKPNPRKDRVQGAAKDVDPPLNLNSWMTAKHWQTGKTKDVFQTFNPFFVFIFM